MNETDKVEFQIQVSAADTSEEDVDRMTRQLLSELREIDVESAELVKDGSAPAGSKGDPVSIGSIAIEVLPAVIPSVIGLVQAWATRGQGRTVKFRGRGFEFEGPPEELQRILATMEKGKKRK